MSSGFVTESELAEVRKQRQDEWERVRQPDQPLERPEEAYDSRSLYERLKEQKDKKDLEYEESHKLKNLIRGLDDDEVDFLEIVDKAKMDAEKKQQIEDNSELMDYRKRVASLQEKSMDDKLIAEAAKAKPKPKPVMNRPSQKSILAGVVRKREANEAADTNDAADTKAPSKVAKLSVNVPQPDTNALSVMVPTETQANEASASPEVPLNQGALKCIGILPGIGKYKESSDSEKSTDTDDDYDFSETDWLGRKLMKDCKDDHHD